MVQIHDVLVRYHQSARICFCCKLVKIFRCRMQAAFGRGWLATSSFLTYVGLGLGLLGSSLALPFGLYVLIVQRQSEVCLHLCIDVAGSKGCKPATLAHLCSTASNRLCVHAPSDRPDRAAEIARTCAVLFNVLGVRLQLVLRRSVFLLLRSPSFRTMRLRHRATDSC